MGNGSAMFTCTGTWPHDLGNLLDAHIAISSFMLEAIL